MSEVKEIVIRKEGNGTYGIGEVIVPGVAFFRVGNYGLTKQQLLAKPTNSVTTPASVRSK